MSLRQEAAGGNRIAVITVTDAVKNPIKGADLKCIIGPATGDRKYVIKKTDANGEIKVPLPDSKEEDCN